ncbi:hypothetical protein [Mongoliimonas terrestris]|uniref:hypothetical protein n=1 Tax=Mongoliimonas terrestris TaxID=1709001 RepID=UPI0009497A76|nr:hypothetical protein [Mongoliimonas terrestris]
MPYNLFIVYDLQSSDARADAVTSAVRALGRWHQFQRTLYYVNTPHDARQALDLLAKVLTDGDRLAVINAASGFVMTWDPAIAEQIAAARARAEAAAPLSARAAPEKPPPPEPRR